VRAHGGYNVRKTIHFTFVRPMRSLAGMAVWVVFLSGTIGATARTAGKRQRRSSRCLEDPLFPGNQAKSSKVKSKLCVYRLKWSKNLHDSRRRVTFYNPELVE
jgi:hypothetical protein